MHSQPTIIHSIIHGILCTLMLSLSVTLTACNHSNNHDENKQAVQHDESHTHQTHESETHTEHQHTEHQHTDATNQDGHNHSHHELKQQHIPKDYTVNFVVSNQPLFLLSEAVTKGTPTTVRKLLQTGDVGHHASLSPSDIKLIDDSQYVVWFGQGLESNLSNTLTKKANAIAILQDKSIKLLPKRDTQAKVIKNTIDPHIWLDPENAKTIVNKLAKLHAKASPKYAETYQQNAENFANKLDKLVESYASNMPKNNQYWSSHDTVQYLEKSLNIKLAGTLTSDHEIPVKASQIVWLKKNRPYPTMCLLTQNKAKQGITEKLQPIKNLVLIEDMSDSDSYLKAWEKSATTMKKCLTPSQVIH